MTVLSEFNIFSQFRYAVATDDFEPFLQECIDEAFGGLTALQPYFNSHFRTAGLYTRHEFPYLAVTSGEFEECRGVSLKGLKFKVCRSGKEQQVTEDGDGFTPVVPVGGGDPEQKALVKEFRAKMREVNSSKLQDVVVRRVQQTMCEFRARVIGTTLVKPVIILLGTKILLGFPGKAELTGREKYVDIILTGREFEEQLKEYSFFHEQDPVKHPSPKILFGWHFMELREELPKGV